jgi:hypothetical protein
LPEARSSSVTYSCWSSWLYDSFTERAVFVGRIIDGDGGRHNYDTVIDGDGVLVETGVHNGTEV